jgi:Cadmium resistance transporter
VVSVPILLRPQQIQIGSGGVATPGVYAEDIVSGSCPQASGSTPGNVLTNDGRMLAYDVNLATVIQAVGTFAVTNVDDIVVLAVFFGQAPGHRGAAIRVIAGQYVGFIAILAVSISGAIIGSAVLPPALLPYLGLLPIMLGLRAAWIAWRDRRRTEHADTENATVSAQGSWTVAGRCRHLRQRR